MRAVTLVIFTLFLCSLCHHLRADNWPQWRGPTGNNVAPGSGYATQWTPEENIAWHVELPGWGTSTPAVWGDRIFVTCADDGKNAIICLNRKGERLWEQTFGEEQEARNRKAGGCNPSPVTDGTHVYCYYKSGDLACLDLEGHTIWTRNLQDEYGPDRLNWDLGTSPALTKNLVIIAVIHNGDSFVLGLDKATGKEIYKADRDLLDYRVESKDTYSTPVIASHDSQETLIVLGADHVTGHNSTTGEEIWRVGGLNPSERGNFRSIASCVVADDMVFAPYARGGSMTAIRLGGKGDVTQSHVAWTNNEASADVPCPVAYQGKLYVSGDRGDLYCVDAKTGKTDWSVEIPRSRDAYSSSPVIADGNIYVTREDGQTTVVSLKDQKVIATNSVNDNMYATPVFVDSEILMRGARELYCIRNGTR